MSLERKGGQFDATKYSCGTCLLNPLCNLPCLGFVPQGALFVVPQLQPGWCSADTMDDLGSKKSLKQTCRLARVERCIGWSLSALFAQWKTLKSSARTHYSTYTWWCPLDCTTCLGQYSQRQESKFPRNVAHLRFWERYTRVGVVSSIVNVILKWLFAPLGLILGPDASQPLHCGSFWRLK